MKKLLKICGNLQVSFFREGDAVIAYSPALDLSTYGSTKAEARKMFSEALEAFIQGCMEMGTLNQVLKECGWKLGRSGWRPPVVSTEDFRLPAIRA